MQALRSAFAQRFEACWIVPDPAVKDGYLVVPEVREDVLKAEGGIVPRPVPFAATNVSHVSPS